MLGFGLGFILNNFSSDRFSQQARVLDSKGLVQATIFHEDVSLEIIRDFYATNPPSSNLEIYQCRDIIGFISVEWVNVSAWQGWLNAHDCELLFSL